MNLERLRDPLLDHRAGLKQHADLAQLARDLDDVLGIVDVVLGEVAVAKVDASLEVDIVGRHVIGADRVVQAVAWTAHGRDHEVSRRELGHVRANLFDHAEALVPKHEVVVAGRRLSIERGVDLLVGTVDADAQHLHEHAASTRDIGDARLFDLAQMGGAGTAGGDADRFHLELSFGSWFTRGNAAARGRVPERFCGIDLAACFARRRAREACGGYRFAAELVLGGRRVVDFFFAAGAFLDPFALTGARPSSASAPSSSRSSVFGAIAR